VQDDHGGSLLPVSRSFVVQLSADTSRDSRRFRGRVEHIASGRSRRFESLDELEAFLAEVLSSTWDDEPA